MSKVARKPMTQRALDAAESRQRILDAAEHAFAERGYAAATIRDITRNASVPLGLANHYFGSKEELFREVITRRATIHAAEMMQALDEALQKDSADLHIEDLIVAYLAPLIIRTASGDAGWKNYSRLLGLALNNHHYDEYMKPVIAFYDPVYKKFSGGLQRLYPDASAERLHLAIYFLQSSLMHTLVEAGMLDRQSNGMFKSDDVMTIFREMVPFFALAFEGRLGPAVYSVRRPPEAKLSKTEGV